MVCAKSRWSPAKVWAKHHTNTKWKNMVCAKSRESLVLWFQLTKKLGFANWQEFGFCKWQKFCFYNWRKSFVLAPDESFVFTPDEKFCFFNWRKFCFHTWRKVLFSQLTRVNQKVPELIFRHRQNWYTCCIKNIKLNACNKNIQIDTLAKQKMTHLTMPNFCNPDWFATLFKILSGLKKLARALT